MKFRMKLAFVLIVILQVATLLGSVSKNEEGTAVLIQAGFLRDVEFGSEWELREDMPVYTDLKDQSFRAGIYQNDDKRKVRLTFSIEGRSKYINQEITVSFDPKYLFVVGMPSLVDAKSGLERKIDYNFECIPNDRVVFKVKTGKNLQYIELNIASRRLGGRDKLTIEDKLKQTRTVRRIRQQLDSWSTVAKGQIIAQKTLKPIVCHGGYEVDGVKTAVIWANAGNLTGWFELIDAEHNRQHPASQPVVLKGKLISAGHHIWGGNNYIADFTDFRKEGLYYLRLRVKETREVVESMVFPIRNGLYMDLAEKGARWFRYQRCGCEVPGFHEACHTGDAIITKDGTRKDVTGGWHDAGDYGKWVWGGSMGILGLTTFQDAFGSELEETLDGMPRFINEAAWEANYFCKAYWDGAFYQCFTPDFEDVCTWLGAPECEPQRVVLEEETEKNRYGTIKGPAISLTGSFLARVGRQVMPYDKELSRRCIEVAEDTYARAIEADVNLLRPEYKEWQGGYLYYLQSGLLFADLEFYEITGEMKYLKDAEGRVQNILEVQDKAGFFYSDFLKTSKNVTCGVFLVALYEFINRHPESRLGPAIKDAFKRWADYTMQFAKLSPFGQIGGMAKDGSIRNIKPNTNNGRFGDVAWGMAAAARLLKEPEYLRVAEQQLQWIIGFNPADVSMMAGVGKGPGCFHTRYCFMEGCEGGVVPGGIPLGIVPGTGKIVELGDMDTKNWVIADVPVDYPVIDTDVWGWTYAYKTGEYALAKNASFIRAASQIVMALRELQ
jgi:endoglucanase